MTQTSRQIPEPSAPEDAPPTRPILFFDGVCGLCNRFVDFVLSRDGTGRVLLAPLQGETAQQRLAPADREDMQTVVLLDERGTYRRSAAVVRVLRHLGGMWSLAGWLLWLVPGPIRDGGYRFVSRRRYRWFGKREACRMPTPEERSRFLP